MSSALFTGRLKLQSTHPYFFVKKQLSQKQSTNSTFTQEYLHIVKKFKVRLSKDLARKTQSLQNFRPKRFRIKTQITCRNQIKTQMKIKNNCKQRLLDNNQINSIDIGNSAREELINQNRNKIFYSQNLKDFTTKNGRSKSFYCENINKTRYFPLKNQIKQSVPLLDITICNVVHIQRLACHNNKLLKINAVLKQRKLVSKTIRQYVMDEQTSNISKIQTVFIDKINKANVKILLCLERMLLLGLINYVESYKEYCLQDISICIESICGMYLFVISTAYEQNISFFQSKLSPLKKQIQSTILPHQTELHVLNTFLRSKISHIIDQKLYEQFETVLQKAPNKSINHTFYNLLTLFATYLQSKKNYVICFFATCPSPYILKAPSKYYTLVLDLDQTLIHSQIKNSKLTISLRPYCNEFLEQMSVFYQIIVFTASSQEYVKQVKKQLKNVNHWLYKQHTIRAAGGYIKDISKIGRAIQRTVVVDDIQMNFRLNKQNGIKIKPWKGNSNDEQLIKLKSLLLQAVINKPQNIKPFLIQIQKKMI